MLLRQKQDQARVWSLCCPGASHGCSEDVQSKIAQGKNSNWEKRWRNDCRWPQRGLAQWNHSEKNTTATGWINGNTRACTGLLNGFPADLGADIQWMFKERVTPEGWRTWDTHVTPTKRRHSQLILLINNCNSPWHMLNFRQRADLVPHSGTVVPSSRLSSQLHSHL